MTDPVSDATTGRLARALALADAFQLCVVFGDESRASAYVAAELAEAARTTGATLAIRYSTEIVTAAAATGDARSVVVAQYSHTGEHLTRDLRALNVNRDTLRARDNVSLVIVLPLDARAQMAAEAPDLWSIRSVTVLLPVPQQTRARVEDWALECRAAFEELVASTTGAASRYEHGVYTFAYSLGSRRPLASLPALRAAMERVPGLTGWRPWWVPTNDRIPYSPEPGILECWMFAQRQMFADPAHSDFWRASVDGDLFLLRGYAEDSYPEQFAPGTRFSRGLPVWRTGEALHHVKQLARAFDPDGTTMVAFLATWGGLKSRRRVGWPDRDWFPDETSEPSQRQLVTSFVVTDTDELQTDLAGVVSRVTAPLDEAFVEEPDDRFVRTEVAKLLRRSAS